MKKLFATLMTVLFLGSTGLVLADTTAAPASTPMVKKVSHKMAHKAKKGKKAPKAAVAPSTTPAGK